MTTPNTQSRAESFMAALRCASKDRGKMAALRRAFSPHNQMDAWPVIADLGGDIKVPVFATIAALYATHPEEGKAANFGATCRQIALHESGDGKLPESHERRFRRLIAADSSGQLGELLRAWIRLASSKGVAVNYTQLFTDLWNWDRRADDIRVHWAAEFWPARKTEEPSVPEEAQP
jgi:CRISPR type I-E-associated protein CasB/Cse2